MHVRRLTLAAAVAAALALPTGAQAAAGCVATATPPHAEPGRAGVHASGTFACAVPSFDLWVEVCVEELHPGVDPFWTTLGCSSTVLNDGGAAVTAEVTVEAPNHTALLRATVTGSNDRGDTASGTSAPAPWIVCGCP